MQNKTAIPVVTPRAQVDTGGATIPSAFTLRDTMAMYALMSFPIEFDPYSPPTDSTEQELEEQNAYMKLMCADRAKYAYMQADAMITERAKALKYKRKGEE